MKLLKPMAVAFASILMMMSSAPAAHATIALIDASPSDVTISAPSPGESQQWDMAARNLTDQTLPLSVAVSGQSARLFAGPDPLQLEIREKSGNRILYTGPVSDLLNSTITLPALERRASYQLVGTVRLPSSAGNDYQNASGSLRFTFHTMTGTPNEPHQLASTGTSVPTATLLVAAGLLTAGWIVIAARRKRKP